MPNHSSNLQEKSRFKPQPFHLMDQEREALRYHHYVIRTEDAYEINHGKSIMDLHTLRAALWTKNLRF